MTRKEKRQVAKLAAGLSISAFLVLGAFVASANAENWDTQKNSEKRERHHGRDEGRRGVYYGPPPVVYGSPYDGSYYGSPYYPAPPPPVVYGPGIGITVPGVSINIW